VTPFTAFASIGPFYINLDDDDAVNTGTVTMIDPDALEKLKELEKIAKQVEASKAQVEGTPKESDSLTK
jgi:hypothetical protein